MFMPDRFLDEEVFKKLSLKDLNKLRPLNRRINELAIIGNQKAYYDLPDLKLEIGDKEYEEEMIQYCLLQYQKERFRYIFSICQSDLLNSSDDFFFSTTREHYNKINSQYRKILRLFNENLNYQIQALCRRIIPIYIHRISEHGDPQIFNNLGEYFHCLSFKFKKTDLWDSHWSRRNKYFILNILQNIFMKQVEDLSIICSSSKKDKNRILKNIQDTIQRLRNLPTIEDLNEAHNLDSFKEDCIKKGELLTYNKYKDWSGYNTRNVPILKKNEFISLLKKIT